MTDYDQKPKRVSLPKQFPDAAFIVKAKFWTPERSTIELTGPYEHDQGFLALMLLSHAGGLGPRERKVAKQLLDMLCKPKKKSAGATSKGRASAPRSRRAGPRSRA